MAKKQVKDVATDATNDVVVENNVDNVTEEKNETVEVSEITENIEDVQKSIENVDVTIETDKAQIEELQEKISEAIKPLSDLTEKVNEIVGTAESLGHGISMDNAEATNFIANEISKATDLKKKVEKIINSTKNVNSSKVTGWWNGMGFDM